jgi:hypothetical protein
VRLVASGDMAKSDDDGRGVEKEQRPYEDLSESIIRDVGEFGPMVFGYDKLRQQSMSVSIWSMRRTRTYGVAFAEGLNIEECEDLFRFEEFEGGDVT